MESIGGSLLGIIKKKYEIIGNGMMNTLYTLLVLKNLI